MREFWYGHIVLSCDHAFLRWYMVSIHKYKSECRGIRAILCQEPGVLLFVVQSVKVNSVIVSRSSVSVMGEGK